MFRGDLVMGIACTALQKDGDPRVDNSIGTSWPHGGQSIQGGLSWASLSSQSHTHHNKKPIFRLLTFVYSMLD